MPVPPCIVSRVMADIVVRGLLDVLRSRLCPAWRGRGLTQRGRRLAFVGAAPLGVEDAPLCGAVTPLGVDVSALAVDRGDNETKAAAPSAMAETRRAPCVMATSLQMGGAARRRKPPSPAVTLKTRKPTGRSLKGREPSADRNTRRSSTSRFRRRLRPPRFFVTQWLRMARDNGEFAKLLRVVPQRQGGPKSRPTS